MPTYLSIREAAEELHSGIITPTELVAETLEHIDKLDGDIHAFITVIRDQAYKDAEHAEREIRTGLYRSQLHGIPIAIKDLISVRDVPLTAGSKVLADNIAHEDAMVVEQLRKAGAIIIGKTNTFEFAYGPYSPPTSNPWDRTRTAGGSSGGAAAAVAAGMCMGAIGSDTGGSIRIPAACCGVTGLKPTYGRVSCHGVIPLSWSLDHVGPLARSAEDCAIVFDAIAGYDPRDPNSISGPPSRPTAFLIAGPEGGDTLSLQGLKLGVPQEAFFAPLDPEVRAAWQAALLVLREEGAEVVHLELPLSSLEVYRTIQKPEASLAHMQKGWLSEHRDDYTALTLQRLLEGQQIPAGAYLPTLYQRRIFSNSMRTVLRHVDPLGQPPLPLPAPLLEQANQTISIHGVPANA